MVVKLKSINIYHDYVTTKIGWRGKQYISRDKEKNANKITKILIVRYIESLSPCCL